MSHHPLMKCGCAAQGTCSQLAGVKFDPPVPSCVIHDCIEPASKPPDLTGRRARCDYYGRLPYHNECGKCRTGKLCQCERPSDAERLPFYEYKPLEDFDRFYCGCHSWD